MIMVYCTLEILTHGEVTTLFRSDARFSPNGEGGVVLYRTEGDESSLTFSDRELRMSRSGACGLSVRFSKEEETEFLLSAEGTEGKIPVSTYEYAVRKRNDGFAIDLRYDLKFFQRIQSFHLEINIKFPEEK